MDKGCTTSFRLPPELVGWLTTQAVCRDVSRSYLLRRLIVAAKAAVVAGTGPDCWPNFVEPPSRQRLPAIRPPERGRRRNVRGQFTS